jgi:hypothetical protein
VVLVSLFLQVFDTTGLCFLRSCDGSVGWRVIFGFGVKEYTISLQTSPQYTWFHPFFFFGITAIIVLGRTLAAFIMVKLFILRALDGNSAENIDTAIQKIRR